MATATPKGELSFSIRVEQSREAYQSFFDHDWAKRFSELTHGTAIEQQALDLSGAWKGAANSAAMPYIMFRFVEADATGYLTHFEPITVGRLRDLIRKFDSEIGDWFRPAKRKILPAWIANQMRKLDAADEIATEEAVRYVDLVVNRMWREIISGKAEGSAEIQLSIAATQKLVFASIYYEYEGFLRHCTELKSGVPDLQLMGKKATEYIGDAFGTAAANYLWGGPVGVARLVRHSLVHNSGRASNRLAKIQNPGVIIDAGRIYVLPEHNRELFNLLAVRATEIAKAMV